MPQAPFTIAVTVTYGGVEAAGAEIWAQDITEGTVMGSYRDDVTRVYTGSDGQAQFDLASITTAYADADTVRIYCRCNDKETFQDVKINQGEGLATLTFAFKNRSGLKAGLKRSLDTQQKNGLKPGLKVGLKNALEG